MQHTISGTLADPHFVATYADSMYRLRYRVFHERLCWDVKVRDGREEDEFDDAHNVYLLATDSEDNIAGGWRLRPTTQPYMLSHIFPGLLHGQPAPVHPDIWEISRFAVDEERAKRPGFGFNETARLLVHDTIRFAVDNRITQYVMVVSVAIERLLSNSGLVLHRFGPPQRIGRVRSVACWLDIDAHTRHVILGEPMPLDAVA